MDLRNLVLDAAARRAEGGERTNKLLTTERRHRIRRNPPLRAPRRRNFCSRNSIDEAFGKEGREHRVGDGRANRLAARLAQSSAFMAFHRIARALSAEVGSPARARRAMRRRPFVASWPQARPHRQSCLVVLPASNDHGLRLRQEGLRIVRPVGRRLVSHHRTPRRRRRRRRCFRRVPEPQAHTELEGRE